MTTNVPEPVFGPNGPVAPSEPAVLAGVQTDMNLAFGGNLNPGLTTPQGQLASTFTAIVGDKNAQFLWFCNQVDPAYNSGRMQDAIARIYFLARNPSLSTVVQCTCAGLTDTVIPVGALARDTAGNIYASQQAGTIPAGGSITLSFANQNTGPIPCPAGTLTQIYQAVTGWESITNPADGILGTYVEGSGAFETRRAASVAANSVGSTSAVLGAVLAVPDVLDAFAYDNYTSAPLVYGGVTIAANSIYVAVLGGLAADVAFAIWTKKAPGCGYTGNTTEPISDPNPAYSPPAPSYPVTFEIPSALDFFAQVTMKNNANVPSNALVLVQTAVIAAFAGTDGYGPRARIGSTVFASRFYPGVTALGAWAMQIISIEVGATAATASYASNAVFQGTISGNILTASSVTGTIKLGDLIIDTAGLTVQALYIGTQVSGTAGGAGTYNVVPQVNTQANIGSPNFTGSITSVVLTTSAVTGTITPGMLLTGTSVNANTYILAQLSGTTGGAGTYSVTAGQANVVSEAMAAIDVMTTFPMENDITANINQAPTVSANAISLVLV